MNYLKFGFSVASASYVLIAVIVNFFEKKLPFLGAVIKYGKVGFKEKSNVFYKFLLDIPKSYFRHYYWTAIISFTFALYQCTNAYVFGNDVPNYVVHFLDTVSEKDRKSHVSSIHMYVALCLMTLQVYRRFYDTHFVSVFGKNSSINIMHYSLGLVYYPGAAMALLCEAPKFAKTSASATGNMELSELTYMDYLAIVVFLWAWWRQYKTTQILADLRKNKKGEVITSEHKVPFGDWFEYFSSPPQIAEILMYTSITVILANHITWYYVYMLVIVNQVESILLSHWWYLSTFKNFPKNRKALIPFVY